MGRAVIAASFVFKRAQIFESCGALAAVFGGRADQPRRDEPRSDRLIFMDSVLHVNTGVVLYLG